MGRIWALGYEEINGSIQTEVMSPNQSQLFHNRLQKFSLRLAILPRNGLVE